LVARSLVTLVLSVALLAVGLAAPAARAGPSAVVPPTVVERLPGLPAEVATFQAADGATLSRPVRTPVPFSLVGFEVPGGASVEFRTSRDGTEWTGWSVADADGDEGPDPGTAEAAREVRAHSLPTWVGAASWLQTRVRGAAPDAVPAVLIDSAGLGRSWPRRAVDRVVGAWRGGPVAAAAVAQQPEIVTRAQWGADESLRVDEPSYARRLEFGVVHHTAGPTDYSEEDAPAVVRGIYAYHVESNGWSDIGYNFLVDRFGTVYEGRAGGITEAVIGAHAGGFNTGSVGVALIGTFMTEPPPAVALDAIERLLAWKLDVHHVDPATTVTATSRGSSRYPEGETVELNSISGHRDVSSTDCPGDSLYALLPAIRPRVVELGGDVLLDHRADPEQLRVIRGVPEEGAVALSARLRPAGAWALEVRDPDGATVHTDSGSGATALSAWSLTGPMTTGRYTYTFSSAGRRSATDYVELLPPEIAAAAATPAAVSADDDGALLEPVEFSAELWDDATWALTVSGPDGRTVHSDQGVGETLESVWTGAVTEPGPHRWRIVAEDAEPAEGSVDVRLTPLERVGAAADPVAAAIELSQVAFAVPGSADHAVLARADVFADAMAGGPLAGTEGPLLLTGAAELDDRVATELDRVLAEGSTVYVLGGEQALGPRVVDDLEDRWQVARLSGSGRVETAARVAAIVVARSGTTTVMVARAGPDDAAPWADALAGGAYGAAHGVPVLLTAGDELSPATAVALADMGVTDTVVLGGTAAVADAVLADLPGVRRVAGADRAATAAAVAAELWGRTTGADGDRLVLAGGYAPGAWTLALAGSPLAARSSAPVLLTAAGGLPPATAEYLAELGYSDERHAAGWVLGDEADVSDDVVGAAEALLG